MSDEIQFEIHRGIGRIEGQLSQIAETIRAHTQEDDKRFEAFDHRMTKTEKKINYFSGAWAAVGAIAMYFLKGH